MPLLKLVKSKADFAKKTEEYYNAIRTNIQFSGANFKVIAVSSVQPGEGKSTTSVNLAISFASVGLRTLLIDADTRNSVCQEHLSQMNLIRGCLTSYLGMLH